MSISSFRWLFKSNVFFCILNIMSVPKTYILASPLISHSKVMTDQMFRSRQIMMEIHWSSFRTLKRGEEKRILLITWSLRGQVNGKNGIKGKLCSGLCNVCFHIVLSLFFLREIFRPSSVRPLLCLLPPLCFQAENYKWVL